MCKTSILSHLAYTKSSSADTKSTSQSKKSHVQPHNLDLQLVLARQMQGRSPPWPSKTTGHQSSDAVRSAEVRQCFKKVILCFGSSLVFQRFQISQKHLTKAMWSKANIYTVQTMSPRSQQYLANRKT